MYLSIYFNQKLCRFIYIRFSENYILKTYKEKADNFKYSIQIESKK